MSLQAIYSLEEASTARVLAAAIVAFWSALLFFPSINFSLLSTEIFPWAILYVFAFRRRIDAAILISCLYLGFLTIAAIVLLKEPDFGESLRALAAYLNCLLIFGVLSTENRDDIHRLSKVATAVMFFVVGLGLLQASGAIQGLDQIFKMLVPRASATSLSFMGGRGATLLSSEPARAGIELVSIYLVARVFILREYPVARSIGDALLGVFILLIIRSAQAFMFYVVFIMIFYNVRLLKFLPVLGVLLLGLYKLGVMDGRVFVLIQELIAQGSLKEAFFLLSNTSGHRVTSIVASYGYAFTHPFGGGIGNWMSSSVDALVSSGIPLEHLRYFQLYGDGYAVPIRSSGFLTNLALDVGIVGILPVVLALHFVLKRLNAYSLAAIPVTVLFICKISFFGSVGNPVIWISTALCLRLLMEEMEASTKSVQTMRTATA